MPGPGESGRNGSIAVAQALQYCVFSLPVTIHAKRAERALERVGFLVREASYLHASKFRSPAEGV
jgi:hypothetical protein